MSPGVVCHIERDESGSSIRRVRLLAANLTREWSPPEGRTVSSVDSQGPSPAMAQVKAAAAWIAETLASVGLRRLACLSVDAQGAVCAWLSAPAADPRVIRATVEHSGMEGEATGTGAGLGAARLLALSGVSSGPGVSGASSDWDSSSPPATSSDTSLQALETLDPPERSRPSFKKKEDEAPGQKHRYAVLAMPDGVIRCLLDELDARKIPVDRVVSIWHALSQAWDASEDSTSGTGDDRVVASAQPAGAVVLVEPSGRLIWAWSRKGDLVAGGSMRLGTLVLARPEASNLQAIMPADGARRVDDQPAQAPDHAVVFSSADAGRLCLDWLAWSAQLGHCPRRVVVLVPPNLQSDNGGGPEALGAMLARSWPGASIDGGVHDDPVGATILALAGLGNTKGNRAQSRASKSTSTDALADHIDRPVELRQRELLVGLSTRPGRADRRLHQWGALALAGVALVVGVFGVHVYRSASLATDSKVQIEKARKDLLSDLETNRGIANLSREPKPKEALETALSRVKEQVKAMKPPRPVFSEAVRVMLALQGVNAHVEAPDAPAAPNPDDDKTPQNPGAASDNPAMGDQASSPDLSAGSATPHPTTPANVRTLLNEIEMNVVSAKVLLAVPDANTGPAIFDKLKNEYPGVLQWMGSTSTSGAGVRQYILTAIWPEVMPTQPKMPASPKPQAPGTTPVPAAGASPASKS